MLCGSRPTFEPCTPSTDTSMLMKLFLHAAPNFKTGRKKKSVMSFNVMLGYSDRWTCAHYIAITRQNPNTYWHRRTGFSKLPIVYRFRVNAGGTITEGIFNIRVFPAWYWEPLIVANNRTLHVEESTSVTIAPSYLKVSISWIGKFHIMYCRMKHMSW